MITLYDYGMAPSPRRPRILLAEKGVAHDTVMVDLRMNEQRGDAYRAINPQCTVPALHLEDGHLAARETIATERFSIADITAVVAVDYSRVVRVKPDEGHPHLLRWRAAMAQRPAMAL